jgi:hypothetical protein
VGDAAAGDVSQEFSSAYHRLALRNGTSTQPIRMEADVVFDVAMGTLTGVVHLRTVGLGGMRVPVWACRDDASLRRPASQVLGDHFVFECEVREIER